MTLPRVCTAYLSLGSNLGDKQGNCRFAIDALAREEEVRVTAVSRFFRTSPVDFLHQDWFVNAAVRIETALPPEALLRRTQDIEKRAGRVAASVRFGPRVLDIDLLLCGGLVMATEGLVLPHPRMHKRRFVLEPLCDIDPGIVHPVLEADVRTLLQRIDDPEQEIFPIDE